MNRTIVLLIGPSGCGKTTLERKLVKMGTFKRVVSVTTRPMRHREMEGDSYNFISTEEFDGLLANDELIQSTTFGGHRYGMKKTEFKTDSPFVVAIIEPVSAMSFQHDVVEWLGPEQTRVLVVYFDISRETCRKNMTKKRRDADIAIVDREGADDIRHQFSTMAAKGDIEADYTVTAEQLNRELPIKIIKWLYVNNSRQYIDQQQINQGNNNG